MKTGNLYFLTLICASLVVFTNDAFSQSLFNKTYDFNHGSEFAFEITPYEDDYIIIGNGQGFEIGNFSDQKLKIMRINGGGDTLWTRVYGEVDCSYFANTLGATITYDGNIIFSGTKTTDLTSELFLMKFNPINGDTIFKHEYSFNDLLASIQVRELSNHDLIYCATDYNASSAFILLRLTEEGEIIWTKEYGLLNEYSPSDFYLDVSDTIYIANCNKEILGPGYHLRKIDSAGNVLDDAYFTGDNLFAVYKSQFYGFYAIAGTVTGPPWQVYLCKLNIEGVVQWRFYPNLDIDTLNSKELYCGTPKEMSNGDVFVCGYFGSNPVGDYKGIICKIDSSGSEYWERYYSYTESSYYDMINNLEVTEDGGAMVVGSALTPNIDEATNFWVMHVDSMGCLIPGCDTLDIAIEHFYPTLNAIEINPNPIADYAVVTIHFNISSYLNGLSYQIVDVSGRLIYQKHIPENELIFQNSLIQFYLDKGKISNGIYIINIFNSSVQIGGTKIVFN